MTRSSPAGCGVVNSPISSAIPRLTSGDTSSARSVTGIGLVPARTATRTSSPVVAEQQITAFDCGSLIWLPLTISARVSISGSATPSAGLIDGYIISVSSRAAGTAPARSRRTQPRNSWGLIVIGVSPTTSSIGCWEKVLMRSIKATIATSTSSSVVVYARTVISWPGSEGSDALRSRTRRSTSRMLPGVPGSSSSPTVSTARHQGRLARRNADRLGDRGKPGLGRGWVKAQHRFDLTGTEECPDPTQRSEHSGAIAARRQDRGPGGVTVERQAEPVSVDLVRRLIGLDVYGSGLDERSDAIHLGLELLRLHAAHRDRAERHAAQHPPVMAADIDRGDHVDQRQDQDRHREEHHASPGPTRARSRSADAWTNRLAHDRFDCRTSAPRDGFTDLQRRSRHRVR